MDQIYNVHSYAEEKAEALERWDEYLKSIRREWTLVLLTELVGKRVEIPGWVEANLEKLAVH